MRLDQIHLDRGQIIGTLANTRGWRLGAELGCFDCRSTKEMLIRAPHLSMIGIDLWENQPREVWDDPMQDEWPDMPGIEDVARSRMRPYGGRAILLKASTHEAHRLFGDGALDFIFIDANHSQEAVAKDLELWTPKVRRGGWIIGHDLSLPGVGAALLDFLACRAESCGRLKTTYPDDVWSFEWLPDPAAYVPLSR